MTTIHHAPPTSTATPVPTRRAERRLRVVLRVNALTSAVAGAILAIAPDRVDQLLDTGHPGWIRLVGVGLLPFAAVCAWLSTAAVGVLRRATPQIVVGDVVWVVASVGTVALGWYSVEGAIAVLGMAAVVDAFALLQWRAWRALRPTR